MPSAMGVSSTNEKPLTVSSDSSSSDSRESKPLWQWWHRGRRLFRWAQFPIVVVTSLVASGVVLGLRELGTLQHFELTLFDQMVQLQPDRGADPRLLVVGITEADIRSQQKWPLSDAVLAKALANLQRHAPRAIGLDIFRDIPNEPGHTLLQAQLRRPNVVVINYIGNSKEERIPAPVGMPDNQIGASDIVSDPDGIVRRNLLFAADGTTTYTSFPLQLALTYLQQHPVIPEVNAAGNYQIGPTVFHPLDKTAGSYHSVDTAGYQILMHYRSAGTAVPQVTLQQVLQGELKPEWVKDKVVLIGATAASAKDQHFTPFSAATRQGNREMAGVIIHAQVVSQILSAVLDGEPLLWYWPDPWEAVWIISWAVVGGMIGWRIRHWVILGLAGGTALVILAGVSFTIFTQGGWVPIAAPALAMVIAIAGVITYKVFHYALYDTLTGLPNRALFLKRLQRASFLRQRYNSDRPSHFAVLFLDLDRFKVVNDNLGHPIGDQLLISSRDRLRSCLRPGDTLARVGGDEFAILLDPISNLAEATEIANQVQSEMAIPFLIQDERIFTSVSIGIALDQTATSSQPEELLRDAHTAMYQAKASGKARQEIFATGMRVQVVRRSQLETDLRRAIEQNEFQLHYQPIVSLQTGLTAGFEALVRWQHPQNGFISPAEFIPVAEESGLIIPLGQWILEAACRQLKQWQTVFVSHPPLMISVNLSGQQFTQPDLVEFIEQTLISTGLDGSSLKLEITESVAMNDVEAAIAMLNRLRELNLQMSIDDFGTGYSSLSYLHRFPVTTLKIDRSFVSRMDDTSDDAAIVQTIVGLAHSLGMNVVAEGVETTAQLARLQTLMCEYGQGYFFSKPLAAAGAANLLKTKTRWLEKQ